MTSHRNAKNYLDHSQWWFIIFLQDSKVKPLAIKGSIFFYLIMAIGQNSLPHITFIDEHSRLFL